MKSNNTTAEGDAVPHGELADLDPVICSESVVELHHEAPGVSDIVRKQSIGWRHHRSIPERVVVPDHSPNFDQLHYSIMILQIVVLVSINEYEIKCPLLFPLHKKKNQMLKS